jgi:hypothetical protein
VVNLNKPVQTRSGQKARIVATDCKHNIYPVIALVERTPGREEPYSYTVDGQYIGGEESGLDLVNAPEQHEVRVSFLRVESGKIYPATYRDGDRIGECHVVAIETVKVTVPA